MTRMTTVAALRFMEGFCPGTRDEPGDGAFDAVAIGERAGLTAEHA
jgi:hypothetical protein